MTNDDLVERDEMLERIAVQLERETRARGRLLSALRALNLEMRDAASHYVHPHTTAADVVRYWADRLAALLTAHGA